MKNNSELPHPLTPPLEHHLLPRMGHALCPFQSLGSTARAHGWPVPCPVHCNPSKAAAATRWQQPSHVLPLPASPNCGEGGSGQSCRPAGPLGLGQGPPPSFSWDSLEGGGRDVTSTTHPPHAHKMLQTVFSYRRNTRRNSENHLHFCLNSTQGHSC